MQNEIFFLMIGKTVYPARIDIGDIELSWLYFLILHYPVYFTRSFYQKKMRKKSLRTLVKEVPASSSKRNQITRGLLRCVPVTQISAYQLSKFLSRRVDLCTTKQ